MVVGVCGALFASGACSNASSPLSCGPSTVDVDGVCLPNGAGGADDAAAGRTSEAEAGARDVVEAGGGAGSGAASGGTSDDGGGLNGNAMGGSSAGEAAGGVAGEGAVGSGGNACRTGRIDCASGAAFAASGKFTVAGSSDLVALDDTTALVGNHVDNTLNIFDLCSGTVQKSWPLPARPDDIAFDAHSLTAYVVLHAQPSIAKIEIDGAGVTLIELPKPAIMLTTGNHGRVFARLEDALPPKPAVSIVDGAGAVVLKTYYDDSLSKLVAYDRLADRLLLGDDGGVEAYSFVEATNDLVFAEYNRNAGGDNCKQLLISPDQRHEILGCGAGNTVTASTAPYQVVDVDPANLNVFYGLFDVGPYPGPAAFSPGARYFFAYSLGADATLVFDVATHAPIGSYAMRADQLSVSPSGRVLMSRQGMANVSDLSWTQLKEPSDCR